MLFGFIITWICVFLCAFVLASATDNIRNKLYEIIKMLKDIEKK